MAPFIRLIMESNGLWFRMMSLNGSTYLSERSGLFERSESASDQDANFEITGTSTLAVAVAQKQPHNAPFGVDTGPR